ncbi:glycosyltransferase [Mangrovibacterium lignilyticum]|uniref:glycosyltransferase n=1 Tax=Mangrovibacterium lignilyticum TaxID=2668052 RepID=UPI0013CFCA82|nr:glycosyltransferase [Mangrovibacterium lignilyticum]
MKITHFVISVDRSHGGTTAYLKLLAPELNKQCDISVLSGKSLNPVDLSVDTTYLNLGLKNITNWGSDFHRFLSKTKPDLVHINGIWTPQNWIFQKIAQNLNITVVLSPHGMLEPYILERNPVKKKIALALYQNRAIKKADFLHVTAESELQQIRILGYDQTAKIIPNGIDISEVHKKPFGIRKKEPFQILFLSRIHPKKGIEHLIKAASHLKQSNIEIKIVGEGDLGYTTSLKNLVTQLKLENIVAFPGGVYGDKKWKFYQEADLFVLPTYSENFGIVIAEALATGIPVITTKGAPWEDLERYKCGWWIDLSENNLVNALEDALSKSPKEMNQMGINGQKLVYEKYDIKAVGKAMIKYYESIKKITNED